MAAALYLANRKSVLGLGDRSVASLVAGGIAHVVSVQPVFVASGLVFAALGFTLRRKLPELRQDAHPVLRKKGLLRP